jgi:hypothetical protein
MAVPHNTLTLNSDRQQNFGLHQVTVPPNPWGRTREGGYHTIPLAAALWRHASSASGVKLSYSAKRVFGHNPDNGILESLPAPIMQHVQRSVAEKHHVVLDGPSRT